MLAEQYRDRVGAMMFISPAINFGHYHLKGLEKQLSPEDLQKMKEGKVVYLKRPGYGE